jgi:uncharacterized membrane protein
MTTNTLHPAAAAYLKRLRHASRRLPRDARQDLISDIEAHLHEAIEADTSEAEVLIVLDRLGSPDEIVAAQLSDTATPAGNARGTREWAAIILLLLGGFAGGVGWLIGLFLLWSSRAWATKDKLIGTLILPGGLAIVLVVGVLVASSETCTGGTGIPARCTGGPSSAHHIVALVLVAVAVLAPLATAVHLARRAQRPI